MEKEELKENYKERIVYMVAKINCDEFLKKIYTCVNFFYKREKGEH